MNRRNPVNLILILLLVIVVVWIDLPNNPGIHIGSFNRDITTHLGLDLQGGLQVLLQAPPNTTPQQLQDARQIVENRSNALGVSEQTFQVAGGDRIVAEFPGLTNTEQVISVLKETGLLEFVAMDTNPVAVGTVITTDSGTTPTSSGTTTTGTPAATSGTPGTAPTAAITATGAPAAAQTTSPSTTETPAGTPAGTAAAGAVQTPQTTGTPSSTSTAAPQVYHTVMTGADLKSVSVSTDTLGNYVILFTLSDSGKKIFSDWTSAHINQYLGIVLDKKVISTPVIQSAITDGSGQIQGSFTYDSANSLAIQLRYGSLPVPLSVVQSQSVGPTLGQDSVRKSLLAGIIGLSVVVLFMGLYYRLPGVIADLALMVYALTTYALFKLIPVTLTLPGIAGFVLSIGMAVDANVLIFERLKEELRAGRTLRQAIDLGWQRAWPSIRDSNSSTIITCIILFWFGSAFGATIVKGFALTLAIGVLVSLFTAIIVTRTFLHTVLDNLKFTEHPRWFGL
jgi:preprotein translocase subunit SecD